MRREPSLTFQGALAILNHYEPGAIGKLDKILGGMILASGLGAGIAAVAGPTFAPLAMFAALWGWVEQKDEAVGLLRQALSSVSRHLLGTKGIERRKLIAAAHTAIAAAAVFESIREHIGEETYKKLALTEAEKRDLIGIRFWPFRENALEKLYESEVPSPSSRCGFEENLPGLQGWIRRFCEDFRKFFNGLPIQQVFHLDVDAIEAAALERYITHYLALAATVPEFCVWAMLGEHAATRELIRNLSADLAAALDANRNALGRFEALLAMSGASGASELDLRAVMERANRAVLDQPIVPMDAERYDTPAVFPAISQIYINPRYRIALADDVEVRPSDEAWWSGKPSNHDIDLTLAGHIMAPNATRAPMLLLGHPGAGKSMLTKVLAARLATAGFTVVRVPLRQVGANAPILDQIQQALDLATNKRVDWWRLAGQSRDTVRVVLLDGLDELLQASSSDRTGYLQEVMEFQRVEADQEQPVIVVVTSRTVVADRVDIPEGTTIVNLDCFSDEDVADWLGKWRRANSDLIASGTVRELAVEAALAQADLARQPLLLLMLAVYCADPSFPALDVNMSTADLYHRLLDNFVRREVAKKASGRLSTEEIELRVRDQLDRLSVAALGMFNRGRQHIGEAELGLDLAALSRLAPGSSHPAELGQRLIAEFFFVHTAQAHLLAPAGADSTPLRGQEPLRSYEFLHATFSEYLVASRIMNELADVAHNTLGGRRGPREPEDDLLFALLSHQPLAVRRSILTFAGEIFGGFGPTERDHVFGVLDILIASYRCRHGSDRYAAYQPLPPDRIRELAAYSANLVSLRVMLERGDAGVPLSKMFGEQGDPARQWRSTVTLWRSGLDADGEQAMTYSLRRMEDSVRYEGHLWFGGSVLQGDLDDVVHASLAGDTRLARWIRFGMATCDRVTYQLLDSGEWSDMTLSWLVSHLATVDAGALALTPLPSDVTKRKAADIATLLMRLLTSQPTDVDATKTYLQLLFALPRVFKLDTEALAATACRHPWLAQTFSQLTDPAAYGPDYPILQMTGAADIIWPKGEDSVEELRAWLMSDTSADPVLQKEIRHVVRRLLEHFVHDKTVRLVDL